MIFNVVESSKRKLGKILEGETFDEVFQEVAERFDLRSTDLKIFCEVRQSSNLRYTIISGQHKIAVLEPKFE